MPRPSLHPYVVGGPADGSVLSDKDGTSNADCTMAKSFNESVIFLAYPAILLPLCHPVPHGLILAIRSGIGSTRGTLSGTPEEVSVIQ